MFRRKRFSVKEHIEYRKHIQEQMNKGKLVVPTVPLTQAEQYVILYK